jgi:hypothetical protein
MNPYTKRGLLPRQITLKPSRRYKRAPEESKTSLFLYRGLLKDTASRVMFVITTCWIAMLAGIWTIGELSPGFNDYIDSINDSDTSIDSKTIEF